jgi:hypothetical protein
LKLVLVAFLRIVCSVSRLKKDTCTLKSGIPGYSTSKDLLGTNSVFNDKDDIIAFSNNYFFKEEKVGQEINPAP